MTIEQLIHSAMIVGGTLFLVMFALAIIGAVLMGIQLFRERRDHRRRRNGPPW